jgi:deazaflavin-dependent oxidoreductase (nitroreductase family)
MSDVNDWNAKVIAEFRANGGKVAQFGDAPLVILNTIGAKSGALRETPLAALVQGDGMYVFASKAGAPTNPAWYHNLKATPEITVEFRTDTFNARLTELPVAEGQEKLAEQAALMPQFGDYVTSAAPRLIPVFSIERL